MPISDVASLVGGAALGAPVSTIFNLLFEQVKNVTDFKPISKDLLSTLERLAPIISVIDSMQVQQGSGPELKFLLKTMERAEDMVSKCSRVQWYSIGEKAWYTMKIKGINQDLLRFCQLDLQFILHRNQLHSMHSMSSLTTKIDILSETVKGGSSAEELFVVPQPETVTIFWLLRPLRELKKMLLEDQVVSVVVSAPSACGKTMLVTKLCHDADVKGKFKQIFFITVSKAPNIRFILHRFLQHTGREAKEFADNLDATHCIQQLLQQLGENGPILLVLDDVWPEDESLLDTFLIQLPDYKILVTSRLEFLRFGPTYYLEPLIDEDVKNLFKGCTSHPNCRACAKHNDLLLKIGDRCSFLLPAANPSCSSSICYGCNCEIEHERPVNVLGVLWHRECFCCDACHKPIAIHEVKNHVSNSRGKFHKSCYHRYCYVCQEKVKMRKLHQHHFWEERYCPAHESDGTPKCYSCERLEPGGTNYVLHGDGRWLCLECMESAVMDTDEAQELHMDIRDFFEGLNMKIEKEFPLLLVEKEALYKAAEEEKIDYQHGVETRGICLSRNQIVKSVSKGTRTGRSNQLIGLVTESEWVVRECEVTAILILYELPRLMTGYILAREMMRAYLRLKGYRNLNKVMEEGICQVLGHMWLESQTYASTDASKEGGSGGFERELVEFLKNKIETDDSPVYGLGFRKVNHMVTNSSLKETLKEIRRWG
ncbi:unnamed protein product [Eruca vesicaria subsp. sativa]|uniref:Uncharacterized protein n=1 Tax=Eruca vesicaria subsp. sativa TaxID=29727 RepID=A0ABC8JN99_ERUVS|nr:unnamed protein product [Eruca vesicaria subsp. sativa]